MKVKLLQIYYQTAPLQRWAKEPSSNLRFSYVLDRNLKLLAAEAQKIQETITANYERVKKGEMSVEDANKGIQELMDTDVELALTPILFSALEASQIPVSAEDLRMLDWLIVMDVDIA